VRQGAPYGYGSPGALPYHMQGTAMQQKSNRGIVTSADISTGLPALDALLHGLLPGDNVVFQVDNTSNYRVFAEPFATHAKTFGRKIIHFHFDRNTPPLLQKDAATVVELEPEKGFEAFINKTHRSIDEAGRGMFYIFDNLSYLTSEWFSDDMLANFFQVICPHLYDLETITYFALERNRHSTQAIAPIRKTTQILLDVYHQKEQYYVRPIKVQQRYSESMHRVHRWTDQGFVPVDESHVLADVLTSPHLSVLETAIQRMDVWNRVFLRGEEALVAETKGHGNPKLQQKLFLRLLRMVMSRDDRIFALAQEYLSLEDILAIGRRTIGTGSIGGKAVGMLLARAILAKKMPEWKERMEVNDAFYVGSDVFYSYIVRNGCWWLRKTTTETRTLMEGAGHARRLINTGTFPPYIIDQFRDMLAYYGKSPIIVRSSSLLEDNFGNAFAGKYDSVFCSNQGSLEQRLEDFMQAAKIVYASSISEEALDYRRRHKSLEREERMGLLVQRVSGTRQNGCFFPQLAGVGFSFNPYAWSPDIDPRAGVLRLVFGLGTRAVDRADDDYTRVVALNAPERRPEEGGDKAKSAQERVDILDLFDNRLATVYFSDLAKKPLSMPIDLFASVDAEAARYARERGRDAKATARLHFDKLLRKTTFAEDFREILATMESAYDHPVEVEFTAHFTDAENYKLNILQCRPLFIQADGTRVDIPEDISPEQCVFHSEGPLIGHSRALDIARIIYVVPETYSQLPEHTRYAVARAIGKINAAPPAEGAILMLGPGRWGTTTPSLGVPIAFAEIAAASVITEIVAMREDVVPDVSLGTHFFSELVESDMLYVALYPKRDRFDANHPLLKDTPNQLQKILPEAAELEPVLRVIDTNLRLYADALDKKVGLHLKK
jgi:pyruvate, water dikinase